MIALETREIGGGIVRRRFTAADRVYSAGEKLTPDIILGWPTGNRRALIENRFIEVYPVSQATSVTTEYVPTPSIKSPDRAQIARKPRAAKKPRARSLPLT